MQLGGSSVLTVLLSTTTTPFDPDRLDEFAKAGVKRVRILGSGEKDCPACAALADQIFPIDAPPVLPPERCWCVPWCRLILVAVAEETAPSTNSP